MSRHLQFAFRFFTWFYNNIQIYDRHVDQARELLSRESIPCTPKIELNPSVKDFYDFTPDDVKIIDYPKELIKKKNPQMKFDLGI